MLLQIGIPDGLKTEPFLKIGKGLYYIETKLEVNWFEANERCHAMDSELITIETMDEWNIINKYLNGNKIDAKYWTSGNDLAEQFKHVWFTSGQPILKDLWAPGEPNNTNNKDERCDELGFKAKPSDEPGLNDESCASLRRFICEKRQVTTVSLAVW